jgi:hypothetical protein|tara:strand:+ start:56 stop:502 length:447 start_codon:yes stop_codon:yes gene_type:complete
MEEQGKPTESLAEAVSNFLPLSMAGSGFLLVVMGFYFYLFPEDEKSVTALIPAIIGFGLMIPGLITIIRPENKKHAMHAGAMFCLIGLLGGLMGIPDFITWLSDGQSGDLDRPTIARVAMVLLCGENLIGSIMSFRLARIKREREAGN